MMSSPIVGFALRGFQFLFGIVILGLSVSLIKKDRVGDLPFTLGFAAFVAGATLLGSFIGIASTWAEFLAGYVGALVDGVVVLINLAGGVLLAIKLKGVNCSDTSIESRFGKRPDKGPGGLAAIDILNGGCKKIDGRTVCVNTIEGRLKYLNSRCQQSQADSVFMFLTIAILLVCILTTYLRMKKGY